MKSKIRSQIRSVRNTQSKIKVYKEQFACATEEQITHPITQMPVKLLHRVPGDGVDDWMSTSVVRTSSEPELVIERDRHRLRMYSNTTIYDRPCNAACSIVWQDRIWCETGRSADGRAALEYIVIKRMSVIQQRFEYFDLVCQYRV